MAGIFQAPSRAAVPTIAVEVVRMADEVVEVTIRPDGAVEMHVDGMAGMACRAETEALVRLLGGDIATDEAQEDGSRRLTLRRSV